MLRQACAALGRPGRALSTAAASSQGDVYDVAIVGAGMVGAAVAALLGEW